MDTFELSDYIEVEDSAFVNIRFDGGANALFTATNVYAEDTQIEIDVVCEKGSLSLGEKLEVKYGDRTEIYEDVKSKSFGKTVWGITHKQIIDDYYSTLTKEKEFAVNEKEGINTVKLIDAIYKSDRERQYIDIK